MEIRARFRLSEDVIIENLNEISKAHGIRFTRNKEIEWTTLSRILSSEKIDSKLRAEIKTGNEPVNILFGMVEREIEIFNRTRAINEVELAVKANTLRDGIEFATTRAKLICNLITLKTLKPILPIYTGCSIIEAEDKTQVIAKARFRVIEELKVDLHEEGNIKHRSRIWRIIGALFERAYSKQK